MTGTGTPCQPRLTRPDTLEAQREWDRLCMDHLRKKEGVGIPPQMSGPPVLVVPPNNACGYPPSRYMDCGAGPYPPGGGAYQPGPGAPLPPAAGHKRSYSSSLKSGPVPGLPDHPAGGG
ncbi:unnamed protein product, partial [Dibothriocephalus latus]